MKSSVLEKWRVLTARIDVLSLRERGLLLGALLVVLYVLWSNLLMAPLEVRQKSEQQRLSQLKTQITALDQQAQVVIARNQEDPDQANRALRSALTTQIGALNTELKRYTTNLIPPAEMVKVLERILAREKGLRLLKVDSLPATPLLSEEPESKTSSAKKTAATHVGIYRRGITLEFDGTFPATLRYLNALEHLPWQLFWDRLDYRVEKYPKARVIITVHTLSLDEGWIGV
ncbi:MAG: hypothetical protein B7Z66_02815 [Chromatiales bacterium 21-64-14]|nr:MAG: hypothetical protein B7Z66_02815 [Chromatiales bacterium 21-64-14]HQU14554.1 type II secretion system protein GspM [Gammaproteobacteria bacterium]